jgi:hypothetical protein
MASLDMPLQVPWAYDVDNKELDPELKPAHRVAMQDHADHANDHHDENENEINEPLLLRNLLSPKQIEEILTEASVDGVWPRGIEQESTALKDLPLVPPCHQHRLAAACVEPPLVGLRSVPHHFAWTDEHVVLYMHNDDWFVQTLPVLWSLIRGAMESRPWMGGGVPVLDEAWVGSEQSMKHVRCIELHHYAVGGGLVTPGHRDCGSALTISVLLSDPAEVSGGDFVTYREGTPIAHKMEQGDAILFNSEDLHNISTVTGGMRQSIVVELYSSYRS